MAIRRILTYPDPQLHRVSQPVMEFNQELRELAQDMLETMREAPGIGLAAPQVGELKRLIVIELPREEGQEEEVFMICNPEITRRDGQARIEEGCLSVPGLYVEVDRAAEITVEGRNVDGSAFKLDASGLLAICIQHEIDHLNGKLLVNYISTTKRELYREQVKRRAELGETTESDGRAAL